MTDFEPLIEQQIGQYESQLRHIDELLTRAQERLAGSHQPADLREQIEKVKGEREKFSDQINMLKERSSSGISNEILEKAGPMGIWDAVAQQLEALVERIERK